MATPPRTHRVLVFDSGVGSLSIGAEIHRLLPELDLLYVMDRGGFPYGLWQEAPLVEHICKRVEEVLQREYATMLVMACNSASTAVLPALRERLSIPVVGVVPAIKPAAALSRSKVIGLLATPGTVSRPYTAQLIADFAADCEVIAVGNGELAPAVEALFWQGASPKDCVATIADRFRAHPRYHDMDTLVLACTHFPLVQTELAAFIRHCQWVDSGQAIARRVASLLGTDPKGEGQQEVVILGSEKASDYLLAGLEQRGLRLKR